MTATETQLNLLDIIIEQKPIGTTPGDIADELWKRAQGDWDVLRPLIVAQVAMALDIRRQTIEALAFREAPQKERKGTGEVVDRVQLVRETRSALLSLPIRCDGVLTTWGDATPEQLEARAVALDHRGESFLATIRQSSARLRLAADNVRAAGASCLAEVPDSLLTCFDGVSIDALQKESVAA